MTYRPAGPIRVLIVEDSPAQRELLTQIIGGAADLVVVGAVCDGAEAVEATERLRPDVVSMDIHLPHVDGYEATRQIMRRCPTPIVLVSASQSDAATRALDALTAGALAVVQKPGAIGSRSHAPDRDTLLTTLRLMAAVPVVTRHPPRGTTARELAQTAGTLTAHPPTARPEVLAIAASTGGPLAIKTVLAALGPDFPLPVLVVQHIAPGFVGVLAEWLSAAVKMPVRLAAHDERMQPGRAYLAPEGHHLISAVRGFTALRRPAPSDRYCPSADTLFESIAASYGPAAVGVILTGMGDDGARGLKRMREAGARTIAQDQASSVVYGMPQAAAAIGAAWRVEPLGAIGAAVRELVQT